MNKKITPTINSAQMRKSRGYSKIVATIGSVVLLLILFAAGCKKDLFKPVQGVCPLVVTDPLDKAVDVPLAKVISATFNTDMDAATVNKATFIIKNGTAVISGTVSATANAATYTFTPDVPLLPFTVYTGTITTGATDKFKTALVADYVWTFTTIPQVTLTTTPVAGGTATGAGVFAQGATVTVTATPATGYTFTNWTLAGIEVSKSTSYTFTMAGNKALVANFAAIPVGQLAVTLTSNPVAGGTNTGSGSYNPGSFVTVVATPNAGYSFVNWTENGNPVSTSTSYSFNIAANRILVANYAVVAPGQFAVAVSSNPAIGGTTTGSGSFASGSSVTVTATPNVGYTFTNWTEGGIQSTNASYTFNINANRNLVANFTPGIAIGPGVIDLGLAANYTILTKAGITTTGVTSIGGNIGVSPIVAAAITGFTLTLSADGQSSTAPNISGRVYAKDYAAPTPANLSTAVSNMETAYTTANGLSTGRINEAGSGNVTGLTLVPGLYKWTTPLLINSPGVTLSGGPNDTWVFQIAQDLIVGNGANINLIGGAQAKNITWVVAGQATLGTNVNFKGNILSKTLVSLKSGSTVVGRLLAQTEVTLIANTVILP
ncbi:hypothetical protein GCM10027049_27360 [Mucilaginibacter puniceus]